MRGAFEVVFGLAVAVAAVGGFGVLTALISRPFLGRETSTGPLLEVARRSPAEVGLLFWWRQRRWAAKALVCGAAVAVLTAIPMLIIWAE